MHDSAQFLLAWPTPSTACLETRVSPTVITCSAMQPQEKQQLATFGANARRRVAQQVKCNVSAVGHA